MFMRQKRNETARLIWITVQSAARRELTRADALGHANIKQRCEIQWEALEFSDEHKWLCDSLKFKAKQEKHFVQRDSRKAFQSPLFTMDLTLTAPWYCGRNVGYSHWILLQE